MSFAKIIDQDLPVKILKNIISGDRLRGAYLFLGPDGVGKRTVALEVAKAVNCEKGIADACDDCVSCRRINSMNHPDVIVISPDSSFHSIKIEKIREILYKASLKPYESEKRVFIINDSGKMTDEAQNALLKLLEDSPKNHILILISSNTAGLRPTLVSRCKVLKFHTLSQRQIQEFLLNQKYDSKDALLFSHMAQGSLGRATSFREKGMILRRDQMVNNFFFKKSRLPQEDILSQESEEDIEESLKLLLYWYRDLLISKFTRDEMRLLNIDRFGEIFSYSQQLSTEKLQRDVLSIVKAIGYIKRNLNPKIVLFGLACELRDLWAISQNKPSRGQ